MMSIRAVLCIFPFLLLPCLTSGASIQGKKFVVTTILRGEPYLSLKADHAGRTGNDKYEGYIMDLLDELASKLTCKFSVKMVADDKYGTFDPATGKWAGMIGEVSSGAADMAVADMSITAMREGAVDFSVPFMHLGITALYKKSSFKRAPISAEDLLNENIDLGVYGFGSTYNFFKQSPIPTYQKLSEKLENGGVLTNSNAEGIQEVIDGGGDYAYFLESPSAEYEVSKNCGRAAQYQWIRNCPSSRIPIQGGSKHCPPATA